MRVTIEKLVYGGEGLAHQDGLTIFAPFVLPGEEVDLQSGARKKKIVRGRITEVLRASPDRSAARCPHFGVCGGCDYQHISYDAQLRYKEDILRETLRRLGRIQWENPITVHASPPWEYRNRAQWKIQTAASEREQSRQGGHAQIGYFRKNSMTLCPVEVCPIISPKLLSVFYSIQKAMSEGALPETLREVEAFADGDDQGFLLNLYCTSLSRASQVLARMLSERIDGVESILLQDLRGEQMALHGRGFLQYKVSEASFRVGHLSFFQVNRFLVEQLASVVKTNTTKGDLAFDLYAGVGLFTPSLAGSFTHVEAVEANPAAARDLEANTVGQGSTINIHTTSTEAFLANWAKRSRPRPNVVIADPPRAGIERVALTHLITIAPPRILYVSCDPSTLARDLAILCSKGYTPIGLHLFDMFPQTYHIESLAILERLR